MWIGYSIFIIFALFFKIIGIIQVFQVLFSLCLFSLIDNENKNVSRNLQDDITPYLWFMMIAELRKTLLIDY